MKTLIVVVWQGLRIVCLLAVFGFVATMTEKSLHAADQPPSTEDVNELMKSQPLTAETWPAWREYIVRLYYSYEVSEPREFYEQAGNFISTIATQNEGTLIGEWAADPVAWIALSHHLQRSTPPFFEQAVAANRRALTLGDPSGISSYDLANALIALVHHRNQSGELSDASQAQLNEAEELLQVVEHSAPQARLSFSKGLIAMLRRDKAAAIPLLRQGALDHPRQSNCAATYLLMVLFSEEGTTPYTELTAPFLAQFPGDQQIETLHAAALFRDERFSEAYKTLQLARRHDEKAVPFLGPESIRAIEEGRVDGTLFEGTAAQQIRTELYAGRIYVNVFDAFRQFRDHPELANTQRKLLEDIRTARPSWFDSHPTFSERLAAVDGFPESGATLDKSPATSLLADVTRIEEQLTELLTGHIHHTLE